MKSVKINKKTNLNVWPRNPDNAEAVGSMVWDAMRPPMARPAFVKSEAILLQKFVFFFYHRNVVVI